MRGKIIFVLILFILINGCAPWMQVGGLYTSDTYNFSVELPQGWMRLNNDAFLLVTRDGVLLQNILIERLKVDQELKHTKKRLKKGMLQQEAAEVILDSISSDQSKLNFELLENAPSNISKYPGFKAVYTYRTTDGLKVKNIYYGFLTGELFYGIRYSAAQRYYFDKDIKTFEKVLGSFRLIRNM